MASFIIDKIGGRVSVVREVKICDAVVESVVRALEWQVLMQRYLNDWEIGEYESLLRILSCVKLDGSNDIPFWSHIKNESSIVKSFYRQLFKHDDISYSLPYRQIWKARISPYVSFFIWEASWVCILAIDKLRRRGKR